MPRPADLQRAFARAIVQGDMAEAAAAVAVDALAPQRRLAIHRNHYLTTLQDALAANFPVVEQLVGTAFFGLAARAFVEATPPREPRLFAFGAGFSGHLATLPSLAALPYLADVARFEYALNGAYHADDAEPLPAGALAALAPETMHLLVLRPHPASRLFFSDWPVLRIWESHQPGADPQSRVRLDEGGDRLVLVRRGHAVEWHRLDAAGHAFLAALFAGRNLGRAAAAAAARDAGFDLAGALGAALRDGVFTGCRVGGRA